MGAFIPADAPVTEALHVAEIPALLFVAGHAESIEQRTVRG
jgi:hypothetical protein